MGRYVTVSIPSILILHLHLQNLGLGTNVQVYNSAVPNLSTELTHLKIGKYTVYLTSLMSKHFSNFCFFYCTYHCCCSMILPPCWFKSREKNYRIKHLGLFHCWQDSDSSERFGLDSDSVKLGFVSAPH